MQPFRPDLGPQEGRCEVATDDFLPMLSTGDPQEGRGYVAIVPKFSTRRNLEVATSPLPFQGPKPGQDGCITPAFLGVPMPS